MIRVNDDPVGWEEGMTVSRVLDVCNFHFPMVVVKVNGTIVKKRQYERYEVPDESDVKVIHMMTGG
jgi:thiamine biosynthesis protein ThiS